MKTTKSARVGDTWHLAKQPVDALPGFKPAKSMVFSGRLKLLSLCDLSCISLMRLCWLSNPWLMSHIPLLHEPAHAVLVVKSWLMSHIPLLHQPAEAVLGPNPQVTPHSVPLLHSTFEVLLGSKPGKCRNTLGR